MLLVNRYYSYWENKMGLHKITRTVEFDGEPILASSLQEGDTFVFDTCYYGADNFRNFCRTVKVGNELCPLYIGRDFVGNVFGSEENVYPAVKIDGKVCKPPSEVVEEDLRDVVGFFIEVCEDLINAMLAGAKPDMYTWAENCSVCLAGAYLHSNGFTSGSIEKKNIRLSSSYPVGISHFIDKTRTGDWLDTHIDYAEELGLSVSARNIADLIRGGYTRRTGSNFFSETQNRFEFSDFLHRLVAFYRIAGSEFKHTNDEVYDMLNKYSWNSDGSLIIP